PRVLQLVQRSNQFNLTTLRHSASDLRAYAGNQDGAAFCIRLSDRIGDNGIIAVVIMCKVGNDAIVETWIMSCRVLGRRVEEFRVQLIVERARAMCCGRIVGRYPPTAKNGMVARLSPEHGFAAAGTDGAPQLFTHDVESYEPKAL